MSETILVEPCLIDPGLEAPGWREALARLGGLLVARGCVDGSYTGAVIAREEGFPTGIEFPSLTIALPHADAGHARQTALAVGRCARPVRFRAMEDSSRELDVRLVALLAVRDPDAHLGVLGRLIDAFSDAGFCEGALAAPDACALARLFNEFLA